jgi:GNAT superfamily N-acetyltransferase
VWRVGDRIVAWGWLEGPGALTLQVDPDPAPGPGPDLDGPDHGTLLADEVLAWAEKASPLPVRTTVSEREPHVAAALSARGYVAEDDGPFFVCLGRGLTDIPEPVLPHGFTFRQCGAEDVEARAGVHRAAWSAWNSAYSGRQHAAMRGRWPYRPEFDLMAVAPDGRPAAYCQGWFDEDSGVGLFEPVGTDPGFRRLGLARALGFAVLHRFAAAGGRLATVNPRGDAAYPDARLAYESMGFSALGRTHTYAQGPGFSPGRRDGASVSP